jgi:signal transduction histidine kinase
MELMLETELTSEQREFAMIADDSIGALLRMTEDILDYSKLESDRLKIESSTFDPRNQIADIVKVVRPLGKAKGVDVSVGFLGDIPPLLVGDVGRIRQVIMNLVGNALKFTSQGQIRIAVEYHPGDSTHGELEVAVSDTGVGIAKEHMPTLFDKHSSAHAATAPAYGGHGIGLKISRSIINLMGGRLEVESQVNRGSTFKFSLPMQVPTLAGSAQHS